MKRAICAAIFCLSCDVEPAITTPESYADFLKLSSQLTCEASLRCCGTLCTPITDAAFYGPSTRARSYLDAGLLTYDRQAAIDCLAAMQQRYTRCDAAVFELPPSTACDKVLAPSAPFGSPCETAFKTCAAPAACSNSSCVLRSTNGLSCNSVTECSSAQDSCCIDCTGVCTPGLGVGQTCTPGTNQMQCGAAAFCNGTNSRCTAYAEAGQTCNPLTLLCRPSANLICLPTTLKCGSPQTNGAACTDGTQCLSTYCQLPNLPNLTQGTCQPHPVPVTVREQLCKL